MIRETDRHQKTPLYAFGDSNVGTFFPFEDILKDTPVTTQRHFLGLWYHVETQSSPFGHYQRASKLGDVHPPIDACKKTFSETSSFRTGSCTVEQEEGHHTGKQDTK